MKVEFHPAARDELVAAADYYDGAVPGLGDRFLVAVRHTIDLALAHPEAGAPQRSARRLLVIGFRMTFSIVCAKMCSRSSPWRISIAARVIGGVDAGLASMTARHNERCN